MAVDLKHDFDGDENRYWVNKNKFWEFHKEYDKLQDEKQNPMTVEMNIVVKLKILGEPPKFLSKDAFLQMTTVYGGIQGVKLYLKKKVIDTVYAWEDSGAEIQQIILKKLIKKETQNLSQDIKHIKMYGTVFNYLGYGLMAQQGKIPNACVPEYLLKLYNNEEETNPRRRLKKLTLEKIVEELGMTSITDGCCTEQIIKFCEIHKITYYALDYKYKLFNTNNHMNYHSNLPRLIFMCAENHLYPIEDREAREHIFRSYSNIGGGMKKYKTQQHFENNKLKISSTTKTFVCEEGMNFYALYHYVSS